MKKVFVLSLILGVLLSPNLIWAQERMPVKLIVRCNPSNWIGKRLTHLIALRITTSDTLRPAREGDTPLLICDFLTVKMKGRPVTAYSYVLFTNNRGKISPVLGHYLGLCSNLTIKDAVRRILEVLQKTARKAMSSTH